MSTEVPFTQIHIDDEIIEKVNRVLSSTRYVKGPELNKFEEKFADLCDVEHAVGVSNGTAALLLAMKSAEIAPGDDVFLPAHTFFATASPILEIGAKPIFVDINPETFTISTEDLRMKVEQSKNPAAVIPVHLYGQSADMDNIQTIADNYGLSIIEDAAQAHAAEYKNKRVGGLGDIGCFSFYPSKNMTVAGDGGMITTDNSDIAASARKYRNHGRGQNGVHEILGLNYRLNEINAAVGSVQTRYVEEWGNKRNAAAMCYNDHLSSIREVAIPKESSGTHHVYHLYVIRAENRDELQNHLEAKGIETSIHYEIPVHKHPALTPHQNKVENVNTAEEVCGEILSLPIHPKITDEEIDYVCSAIKEYYT